MDEPQEQSEQPRSNGPDGGRDAKGKFVAGNRCSKGNRSFAAEINKFRAAVYRSIKTKDVQEVVQAVLAEAKAGNIKAATLLTNIIGANVKHVDLTLNEQPVKLYVNVDDSRV